jgi:hypothetical protein
MSKRDGGGLDDLDDLAFGSVVGSWTFVGLVGCATK